CAQTSHPFSPSHSAPLPLRPRAVPPAWPARRSDLRQRNRDPSALAADPGDIDPAAERQDALAHAQEPERLGAASDLGVYAAAVILDGERKLVGVGPDRHVDPGGAGV